MGNGIRNRVILITDFLANYFVFCPFYTIFADDNITPRQ